MSVRSSSTLLFREKEFCYTYTPFCVVPFTEDYTVIRPDCGTWHTTLCSAVSHTHSARRRDRREGTGDCGLRTGTAVPARRAAQWRVQIESVGARLPASTGGGPPAKVTAGDAARGGRMHGARRRVPACRDRRETRVERREG